ncbi:aldehyde dehydrogenase, partial [Rhodanobacter sp. 115]
MSATEPVLIAGQWQAAREVCGSFRAEDPTRGEPIGPAFPVCGGAHLKAPGG